MACKCRSPYMRQMMHRLTFVAAVFAFSTLVGPPARAQINGQIGGTDLLVRIDQLEGQLRQLTGMVEQMQYRNAQLEAAVKRLQDDADYRSQGAARSPVAQARPAPPPAQVTAGIPAAAVAPAAPTATSGRRSDAFDPNANPNAPGAPRALGSIYANAPALRSDGGTPVIIAEEPVGRVPGQPLDLGAMANTAPADQGYARVAPPSGDPSYYPRGAPPTSAGIAPRNPPPAGPTGSQMALAAAPPTLPPSSMPRDVFDLGYGYLQRKDYGLAEETFRDFMRKYPSDRLAGDAQFMLGESLYQHQSYRDAADAFLTMSKRYETSPRAPNSLLRLGQSLAALNEKELACATFGEVGRKFPRAPTGVKQSVDREQKRLHC